MFAYFRSMIFLPIFIKKHYTVRLDTFFFEYKSSNGRIPILKKNSYSFVYK